MNDVQSLKEIQEQIDYIKNEIKQARNFRGDYSLEEIDELYAELDDLQDERNAWILRRAL